MPKRLMGPDVRVLWNIHGFVVGEGMGSNVGNEIKRRGLFLQGSGVFESVHCKRGSLQESHLWNGNDKAWNTHNQLFSLAFKIQKTKSALGIDWIFYLAFYWDILWKMA